MMKDLRVFFNPANGSEPCAQSMFYSRRADGPYYRWRYQEELGQWCGSRVPPSDSALKALCLARWKVVPAELQESLADYYIE
jgi:hypothetical protein